MYLLLSSFSLSLSHTPTLSTTKPPPPATTTPTPPSTSTTTYLTGYHHHDTNTIPLLLCIREIEGERVFLVATTGQHHCYRKTDLCRPTPPTKTLTRATMHRSPRQTRIPFFVDEEPPSSVLASPPSSHVQVNTADENHHRRLTP